MKLLFTGDSNFSRREAPLTENEAKIMLEDVMPYAEKADFRMANVEEAMGDINNYEPIAKSGPNLISDAKNVVFYKELKTDVAILANNHTGDYGEQATMDTIDLIEKNNMLHIGAGKNIEEAYNAVIVEKDGVKLSMIAVCENEFGIATKDKCGSAGFNALRLCKKIKEEKEKADLVLVVFHGGNETNPIPSPKQIERYRLIIEFGADAVVAMHTHCPQGYEYYNGKPIIYSLGNFIFQTLNKDISPSDPWFYGYMAMLDATKEGIKIEELIPYKFNNPATKITVFQGEDKQKMLDHIEKISDYIKDEDFVQKHFSAWITERLQWTIIHDLSKEENQTKLCAHKNSLSCEAHNEVLAEGYRLYMTKEYDEAHAKWEESCARGNMPV